MLFATASSEIFTYHLFIELPRTSAYAACGRYTGSRAMTAYRHVAVGYHCHLR